MTGGLLGALPLQQTHCDAEQPLLMRVFCTKDKAQVAFEPTFHWWQGLCQVLGGCMSCWGSTPTPHTPWQGGNLHPTGETGEAEVDPCPDRANPAPNPSRGAGLVVTAELPEIITTCTPNSSTSSALPGLRAASPPPAPCDLGDGNADFGILARLGEATLR